MIATRNVIAKNIAMLLIYIPGNSIAEVGNANAIYNPIQKLYFAVTPWRAAQRYFGVRKVQKSAEHSLPNFPENPELM